MVRRGGLLQKIIGTKVSENIRVRTGVTRTHRESKGVTDSRVGRWSDKRPHPANMSKYEDLNKDSAVSTAITMLTGMIAGVGFHTEMPEEVEKPENAPEDYVHPTLIKLNDYLEKINFDRLAKLFVRITKEKGFCPIEKLPDGNFKILPPETFYIWRKPTGELVKYTQDIGGQKIADWNVNEIIVFYRMWSPSRPYGKAVVEDLVDRIEARRQIAEDVPEVIHKQGYPFRVIESETEDIGDTVYTQFTEKEPEEDVFIDSVSEGDIRIHTETLTPRIDFTEYIKHNDEMIAEGLNAPLPVWMKNTTEASANVIMESIERDVESDQRDFAREFEKEIYKPYVGSPTPRHIWGPSETGLEDITLEGVAALYNGGFGAITFAQAQALLHDLGVPIGEVETEPPEPTFDLPPNPMNPMQDQELYVIEANYTAQKISLTEALEGGRRIIEANVKQHRNKTIRELEISLGKRPDPLSEESEKHFELIRNELFTGFRNRLLSAGVKK